MLRHDHLPAVTLSALEFFPSITLATYNQSTGSINKRKQVEKLNKFPS